MPPFQSLANSFLSDKIKTKLSSTADVADVADHASRFDISAFEEGREDEMSALIYRNALSTFFFCVGVFRMNVISLVPSICTPVHCEY